MDWETLPTTQRVVGITFDGGWSATGTDRILATLAARDVRATFFFTGVFVKRNPEVVRQVAAAGHTLGNHSETHTNFTELTYDAMRADVRAGDETLRAVLGYSTKPLFRFPSGDRNALAIQAVNDEGWVALRWTIDSNGWRGVSGGQTVASACTRVLDAAEPGAVFLLHVGEHPDDGSTLDADALPCMLEGLKARGYGFFTLDAFAR